MTARTGGPDAGWSLIELLVATALAAALLGVAVPNVRALGAPWALRGASLQVAADIRLARQLAIARNVRCRLRFQAPRSYWLERETRFNRFTAVGGMRTLPASAALGRVRPATAVFDTRGMLATAVRVPISVRGGGRRTVAVNVLGHTTID